MTKPLSMSVSEARANLPELLDRIERGEEITITRHGRPAAVMLRPDTVRARRAERTFEKARQLSDLLAAARNQPLPPATMTAERAQELVDSIRADRDS